MPDYQAIVIGGGHAGIEAVNILNLLKVKTLLITPNSDKIGYPSCNPSIGGIAKSHLVYELDAMGGLMPVVTDRTGLHFKLLNSSKGPAVWSLRVQIDTDRYTAVMRDTIRAMDYITILEDTAEEIRTDSDNVRGILTQSGESIDAENIILCTGTFLNGIIHIGNKTISGGRYNDHSSERLSESLVSMGYRTMRLKTGTSPRILGNSINFSKLTKQPGENNTGTFSITTERIDNSEFCYITRTNKETHSVIEKNLKLSALYSEQISGTGPKYCPSIEDKIVKFNHRDSHTVFIEPMGLSSDIYYLNGASTSLPVEKQYQFIHTIEGLENAEFKTPGYAIEYDFIPPGHLRPTLESSVINGLYFAGQINGSSGYEEAAAQGYAAGLNAGMSALRREPVIFSRYNSYTGVMIDDLLKKEITEPYRLFTSRSENRLVLRQDNAFIRMKSIIDSIDIDSPALRQYRCLEKESAELKRVVLDKEGLPHGAFEKFRDPAVEFSVFRNMLSDFSYHACLYVYSQMKYRGYIKRFETLSGKIEKMKDRKVRNLDFILNSNLISKESKSIIEKHSIERISDLIGLINPADIENIIIYILGKKD
ncbi:MAG: tRNA uridine-5-carboxymethylaminomethyl(34) synthesis enzyme MnmG [candidate division WOR-3 bacterium]|nr:tRNA uridine-5-carboxymethylaminomethyl(34) synthesis enzyme MnmG [candidate division WOR-3 bacterium]